MRSHIAGLVLAGGQSRRMGGRDKSFVELDGKPLIQHVIDRAGPQVATLAINTNSNDPQYAALGLPIIPDVVEGFQGPLAGIHAGLKWLQGQPDRDWLATFACDTPFVPTDCVDRLWKSVQGEDSQAAIAEWHNKRHPTVGLWSKELLPKAEHWLQAGNRMLMAFADDVPVQSVDFSSYSGDPFININAPDDIATAETQITNGR